MSWPKKTKKLEENQKKQTWTSDQTLSEKFCFFCFLVFSRFFGFPHGFSPKESSNSWLVPLNLEKTKKTKNQNFSENVWSEVHVWFFLVFLEFFFGVFLVMTLKKLKKLEVFWLFEGTLTWSKAKKPKKLRSFLVFGQIFWRHVKTIHAKNQKRPEFFWVFTSL